MSGAVPLQPRGPEQDSARQSCGFHEVSLSGFAADLPSKKSFRPTGTLLEIMKMRRLIDSTAVPAQVGGASASPPPCDLHPKFTTHRAKWVD
jgi:hypothetical protein